MSSTQKPTKKGFLPRKKTPLREHITCAVCLDRIVSRQTYEYSTSECNCVPFIHDTCFEKWNRVYPNTCSICKTKGTPIVKPNSMKQQVAAVGDPDDSCCLWGILGCWGCINMCDIFIS
jgi:hypothetical protein